jgi:hypothetical protein
MRRRFLLSGRWQTPDTDSKLCEATPHNDAPSSPLRESGARNGGRCFPSAVVGRARSAYAWPALTPLATRAPSSVVGDFEIVGMNFGLSPVRIGAILRRLPSRGQRRNVRLICMCSLC